MENDIFDISEYDYKIPSELIAQNPVIPRDNCRLLILQRNKTNIREGIFKDVLGFLKKGDVLVLNNTKVIKARIKGRKKSGGKIEVLVLKKIEKGVWEALVKPGKRARVDDIIFFDKGNFTAEIIDKVSGGLRILKFNPPDLEDYLFDAGDVPLPPYIKKEVSDFNDYQTVYAKKDGAVAAPTAGLHFTDNLISEIKAKGVNIVYVTLHCGLSTFRPVKKDDIRDHDIGFEWINVSESASETINLAKKIGKRVIAVGTTAIRTLESIAFIDNEGIAQIKPYSGETDLYIVPGYKFKMVDSIITNFHTPRSSNLILISSFYGVKAIRKAYKYAQDNNFRFFSFGDATIITD
ncbi:MAG: tRNA preQ1(34) S-adenosylmethionine ribosyltransferase-isomerase QueA [Candidatus Omnitrophica bacterium]|nr:tRNA preQ1(34) S-adenosylmethionine ribosyltransferase-isomerase QueA [Candidatus Omnitrophota bacterium]